MQGELFREVPGYYSPGYYINTSVLCSYVHRYSIMSYEYTGILLWVHAPTVHCQNTPIPNCDLLSQKWVDVDRGKSVTHKHTQYRNKHTHTHTHAHLKEKRYWGNDWFMQLQSMIKNKKSKKQFPKLMMLDRHWHAFNIAQGGYQRHYVISNLFRILPLRSNTEMGVACKTEAKRSKTWHHHGKRNVS